MSSYFCKNCGSSTTVASCPPKFCSSCGESFNSESGTKLQQPQKTKYTMPAIVIEDDDDIPLETKNESNSSVKITKRDIQNSIEIVGEESRGAKFSQIINEKPQGGIRSELKIKGKKAKEELKKKQLQEFKKQGSQMKDRNNIEIIGTPGDDND